MYGSVGQDDGVNNLFPGGTCACNRGQAVDSINAWLKHRHVVIGSKDYFPLKPYLRRIIILHNILKPSGRGCETSVSPLRCSDLLCIQTPRRSALRNRVYNGLVCFLTNLQSTGYTKMSALCEIAVPFSSYRCFPA